MSGSYHQIDLHERRQIYLALNANKSVPEIARYLGRHRFDHLPGVMKSTS